jgi:1-acyl-sn-glycerol-3-phosphate acyltransferase
VSKRPWVDRLGDFARVSETPGRFTRLGRLGVALQGPLVRLLFRPSLQGCEHLPEGPFLVVANHSGGGYSELSSLAWLWQQRFGDSRPVAAMAAPPVFLIPGGGMLLGSLGAVPATYRHAEAAFASGASVLVFPGGDFDCFRPIWQANKVDFNGRKGYLRLARKAGVPVVPLGIHGSHYTAPVLWRSRVLPWLLLLPRLLFGVKRLPVTVVGLIGAAAIVALAGPTIGTPLAVAAGLLWLTSPLAFMIPVVPWTITLRFGPALHPSELFTAEDPELDAASERVLAEVQRLVLSTQAG